MASPSATVGDARGAQFWTAAILLTCAVLFWSGTAVIGRSAAGHVPPFALSFWRWLMAFCIFLPLGGRALWLQRRTAVREWKWLVALSFLGMGGFAVPYFTGLQFTQAVNAAVLNALGPVMILVIAAVTIGTRINAVQLLGVALGLGGTAMIVFRGDLDALLSLGINVGDAFLLLAVFFWSGYTVAFRRAPVELDQWALMLVLSGLSVPMLAPFYAMEWSARGGFDLDWHNLGVIFYSGFCSSVLAYLCWNKGVAILGAARAGVSQYLMPVFGALLAWAILGEEIGWFHYAGIVLIFAGIALSGRRG
jgi:drug/metabolite transporter (DMT)-like permease